MPIPEEQFEKGSETTENNILNFLKAHPKAAYNSKEIAQEFGIVDSRSDSIMISFVVYSYSTLLDSLVKKRAIRKKIIGGVAYYIFQKAK
jgi:hypothetical protein